MLAELRARGRAGAALLAVALVTTPTVLSLLLLPGLLWLTWRSGLGLGAALAAGHLVAFAVGASVLRPSGGYYRLRPFEASGVVYERMGVRLFRRFVVGGDYFNRAARCYDPSYVGVRGRAALKDVERRGRVNERLHVGGLLALLPPTARAGATGWWELAGGLLVANVLVNV